MEEQPGEAGTPQPQSALAEAERPVTAVVSAGDWQYAVVPNPVGTFVPRVRVEPRQTIAVAVACPQAEPGASVVAAIEDGGQLDDGQRVVRLTTDAEHQVKFQFTAGADRGIYRVALRQGTDLKYLEFWAGEELTLKGN